MRLWTAALGVVALVCIADAGRKSRRHKKKSLSDTSSSSSEKSKSTARHGHRSSSKQAALVADDTEVSNSLTAFKAAFPLEIAALKRIIPETIDRMSGTLYADFFAAKDKFDEVADELDEWKNELGAMVDAASGKGKVSKLQSTQFESYTHKVREFVQLLSDINSQLSNWESVVRAYVLDHEFECASFLRERDFKAQIKYANQGLKIASLEAERAELDCSELSAKISEKRRQADALEQQMNATKMAFEQRMREFERALQSASREIYNMDASLEMANNRRLHHINAKEKLARDIELITNRMVDAQVASEMSSKHRAELFGQIASETRMSFAPQHGSFSSRPNPFPSSADRLSLRSALGEAAHATAYPSLPPPAMSQERERLVRDEDHSHFRHRRPVRFVHHYGHGGCECDSPHKAVLPPPPPLQRSANTPFTAKVATREINETSHSSAVESIETLANDVRRMLNQDKSSVAKPPAAKPLESMCSNLLLAVRNSWCRTGSFDASKMFNMALGRAIGDLKNAETAAVKESSGPILRILDEARSVLSTNVVRDLKCVY